MNQFLKVAYALRKRQRYHKSGIADIDRMSGREFEEYLRILFVKLGYQVRMTSYTGDYGGDLIARKDGDAVVIQAKRYKKRVGVRAVQEVTAAKGHYNCPKARIVTNSYYTEQACTLAKSNGVELWNRDDLVSALIEIQDLKK
jgi:restriction system protein